MKLFTVRLFPLLLIVWTLAACRQESAPTVSLQLKKTVLTVKQNQINAEVADTPDTMQRGLMFRDSLPSDSGMLFVFEQPQRASFWMRNTKIPLSIAYLDRNGIILEIHDMFPYDESPVSSYGSNVCYALEMNQGWFKKHGIEAGMSISGNPINSDTLK